MLLTKKPGSTIVRLSASDLSNHLACNHLTTLDLAVAKGWCSPPEWRSPDALVLQQRGMAHENAYVEHLSSRGLGIVNLRDIVNETEAVLEAIAAMQTGVDVIVQPVLTREHWFGRADVLRKIPGQSAFGDWSYEVYDCKLAVETKAGTILQLSLYSELLAAIQGVLPEFMHVIPPSDRFVPETFRVSDFSAYHRHVKRRLESAIQTNRNGHTTYPEPTEHCAVCRWWQECDRRRRIDDHLSLVAGITKLQRKQLQAWDVNTVEELAVLPIPLARRPECGSKNSYVRVREQARIQVAGRTFQSPVYEVLDINPEHGFCSLPRPSPGDVFFDLEGDPFVGRGGQEYLFGIAMENGAGQITNECQWALTPASEKAAFEWFVDLVMARWAKHPEMHIYHFTSYEPAALKRLMGRYATREDEIDRMLRARLFVDLHCGSRKFRSG